MYVICKKKKDKITLTQNMRKQISTTQIPSTFMHFNEGFN